MNINDNGRERWLGRPSGRFGGLGRGVGASCPSGRPCGGRRHGEGEVRSSFRRVRLAGLAARRDRWSAPNLTRERAAGLCLVLGGRPSGCRTEVGIDGHFIFLRRIFRSSTLGLASSATRMWMYSFSTSCTSDSLKSTMPRCLASIELRYSRSSFSRPSTTCFCTTGRR